MDRQTEGPISQYPPNNSFSIGINKLGSTYNWLICKSNKILYIIILVFLKYFKQFVGNHFFVFSYSFPNFFWLLCLLKKENQTKNAYLLSNSLSNNKILDWSKLKAFADEKTAKFQSGTN